jgi:hypothetical protein
MFTVNFTANYLQSPAARYGHAKPIGGSSAQVLPVIIPQIGICTTLPLRSPLVKRMRQS